MYVMRDTFSLVVDFYSFSCYIYSMTITQTVEILENRRLIIDVPREVPTKAVARFELVWSPKIKTPEELKASLEKIWEICKDAPVSVDSFLETRREDNELEEAKYRRLFGEDN